MSCLVAGVRVTGGRADVAADDARHIPVRVIATMLGVPPADEDTFTGWAVTILQEGFTHIERAADAARELIGYFRERLAERRGIPPGERPEDLLTLLIEAEHDDAPLTERHLIGSCFLLLIAGIDTTWSAISSSLWHLATHQDDQARLRAEPDLLPYAVEELLRFYSPVTMARFVTEDVEFGGCPMRRGDKVLMTGDGRTLAVAHRLLRRAALSVSTPALTGDFDRSADEVADACARTVAVERAGAR